MENHELAEKATHVITNIMGCGAFIFIDPLPESARPNPATWESIGVSLSYGGSCKGHLSLWAAMPFIRTLCSNMIGADEGSSIPLDKLVDALKEILNMIVGNLLTVVYGDAPVFELGLPELLNRTRLQSDLGGSVNLWFSAEDEPVLFSIDMGE